MSTTDLFVELMVIGIGAAIWLILLIFSIFGYKWILPEQVVSLVALIPVAAVVYVLGIVVDRIADTIFEKLWGQTLCKKVYETKKEYYDDRRLIYTRAERLGNLLEYGRSRLRICRGWTLNTILILITQNMFIWTWVGDRRLRVGLGIFCNIAVGLFAFANWFAWRQLSLANYRKVREQSAFLRSVESSNEQELLHDADNNQK
ncbi:MAG: hypothetical protein GY832_04075 [Chloroflexi bacterium]|nr:hypothetical protein [Chloroflexota bacterium]